MTLASEHLAYLKKRGITSEDAELLYQANGSTLLIPYKDPNGTPYTDSKGHPFVVERQFPTSKPKFKSPAGSGSRPYFSPLMPEGYLDNTTIPLVLIEGPIKVDACWLSIPTGYCFVGLTGTWNIKDRRDEFGEWHQDNDTRVLPELKEIPLKGRQLIVLFDSDIADNRSVAAAAKAIANWSRGRGARPLRCLLPSEPSGDKNGADDFLVRHGAEALIDRLHASKIIGYPLPAPLLTPEGDIRHDYDPLEEEEVIAALAEIADINTLDACIRRLSRKLHRKYDELLALVDDVREGDSDRGFLSSDDELDSVDLDSRWLVPDFLPRGEVIVIAADSGVGKSLLTYDLCRAFISGGTFLGFNVPKLRVLILQLEEGATMGSRLKAMGFHQLGQRKVDWDTSTTFDLAKPRHRQQLQALIRDRFDFVMIDPLRAVGRSFDVDENTAEIGKRVVRPIRDLITKSGASGVLIHHNSRHSGKYAGNGDIKAAVWGLFSLRRVTENDHDNLHLSSLEAHDGKTRDGDPILWHIRKERSEGFDGSRSNVSWTLEAMLQHTAPDLPLLKRVQTNLAIQSQHITLRQLADCLGLPNDSDGKVNGTLRSMAAQSAAIRQWAVKKPGQTTTYWMPHERRPESIQKQRESASLPLTTNQLTPTATQGVSGVKDGLNQGYAPPDSLSSGLSRTPENGGTHTPPKPTGIPVYVDGKNGWTSPSGRIDKGEYLLLVDPQGNSRRIERKRVSVIPPDSVPDLPSQNELTF